MPQSILVVDDDDDLLSLLDQLLSRAGYTIHKAPDAEQAIRALETTIPDLFLVDVMLPGMDGFELSRYLRAKLETAQHPIILLSARTDSDSMFKGLESGANLYLTKPIDINRLIARIEESLSKDGQS